MKKQLLLLPLLLSSLVLQAQFIEAGMEIVTGPAHTTFRGDLAGMVGFSELEITQDQIDTAFARFDLDAPRWLTELFPGLRIEVTGEIAKTLNRNVSSLRFFCQV